MNCWALNRVAEDTPSLADLPSGTTDLGVPHRAQLDDMAQESPWTVEAERAWHVRIGTAKSLVRPQAKPVGNTRLPWHSHCGSRC